MQVRYSEPGMANLRENLTSALRTIRENWLRSALTMLGIIIGVGSVVLLVAIGQGVKEDVTKQIESLGTNVAVIVPGKLERSGQPNFMATLGISTLTQRDLRSLQALPGINLIAPLMFVGGMVERNGKEESALVVASTPAIYAMRPYPMEEGRFFGPEQAHDRVCVLAHDPKERIFGNTPALGKTVRVRGIDFTVAGVLAREDESLFGQGFYSNLIYLPIEIARDAFKAGQINRFFLQTDYKLKPGVVVDAVRRIMMSNHNGKEDFGILTEKQLLSAIYKVFNIVTALLAGISAISLVVAGIGIMNIMLVTVTERTREIGIRKTVGARRADIFVQFLTEAVVLAFTGGVIGTLLAASICSVVGRYSSLKPLLTVGAIAMAFGVCFLVGIVFGVAPAMRAARQDPIDALRYE